MARKQTNGGTPAPKKPSGGRKPPPMAEPSEGQRRMDLICSRMSADIRDEFNVFLRYNPGLTDINQWVREHTGEDVAIAHIGNWYQATFPTGEQAKILNGLLGAYQGLEIHRVAHMALGVSLQSLIRIQEHFVNNEEAFRELTTVQAVNMIPGLLREVRSLVQQIEQQGMAYDAMQQELGGAALAIQELLIIHRDTPMEEPIKASATEIFNKIRQKYVGASR